MRKPASWHHLTQHMVLILGVAWTMAPRAQAQSPVRGRIIASSHDASSMRVVDASFTVDHDAYVIVGHEGADGRIRIMYPTTPLETGFVRAGVRMQTAGIDVSEDLPRNGFVRQINTRRTGTAAVDSYDGIGVGYVFLIASTEPLRTDGIVDGDQWTELTATNYFSADDPRIEIRDLADQIGAPQPGDTDMSPELLTFAGAYSTVASGAWSDNGYGDGYGYGYIDQSLYSSQSCARANSAAFQSAFFGLGLLPLQVGPLGYGGYGLSQSYLSNGYGLGESYLSNGGPGCYGYNQYAFGSFGFGSGFPPFIVVPATPVIPHDTGSMRRPPTKYVPRSGIVNGTEPVRVSGPTTAPTAHVQDIPHPITVPARFQPTQTPHFAPPPPPPHAAASSPPPPTPVKSGG